MLTSGTGGCGAGSLSLSHTQIYLNTGTNRLHYKHTGRLTNTHTHKGKHEGSMTLVKKYQSAGGVGWDWRQRKLESVLFYFSSSSTFPLATYRFLLYFSYSHGPFSLQILSIHLPILSHSHAPFIADTVNIPPYSLSLLT